MWGPLSVAQHVGGSNHSALIAGCRSLGSLQSWSRVSACAIVACNQTRHGAGTPLVSPQGGHTPLRSAISTARQSPTCAKYRWLPTMQAVNTHAPETDGGAMSSTSLSRVRKVARSVCRGCQPSLSGVLRRRCPKQPAPGPPGSATPRGDVPQRSPHTLSRRARPVCCTRAPPARCRT